MHLCLRLGLDNQSFRIGVKLPREATSCNSSSGGLDGFLLTSERILQIWAEVSVLLRETIFQT